MVNWKKGRKFTICFLEFESHARFRQFAHFYRIFQFLSFLREIAPLSIVSRFYINLFYSFLISLWRKKVQWRGTMGRLNMSPREWREEAKEKKPSGTEKKFVMSIENGVWELMAGHEKRDGKKRERTKFSSILTL